MSRYKKLLTPLAIFVLLSLLFGAVFIKITPLFWGADEPAHFARAYNISEGHLRAKYIGNSFGEGYGGNLPTSVVNLNSYVSKDLSDNGIKAQVDNKAVYKQLGSKKLTGPKTQISFSNTAAYSPVPYIPSIIAILIARVFNFSISETIYFGRILDLLSYVSLVSLALFILRNRKLQWIVFTVALIPMAVFQASIISADSLTNALVILYSALFIKALIYEKLNKKELIMLGVSAILLPLVKPTYVILLALLLLIPNKRLSHIGRVKLFKTLMLSFGLIGFLAWSYATRNVAQTQAILRGSIVWRQVQPHSQESFVIRHPLSFIKIVLRTLKLNGKSYIMQLFGMLGFNTVQIPIVAVCTSIAAVFVSIINGEKLKIAKQQAAAIILVIAASILFTFTTIYITYSRLRFPTVEGIQGRYFIPYLIIACIPIVYLFQKLKLKLNFRLNKYIKPEVLMVLLATLSLILASLKYYHVTWG
jgi:uncharacterized membrane protein